MKTYEKKIAYLKLLVRKVASYQLKELEELLEFETLQDVLNMAEEVNWQTECKSLRDKEIINQFLNTYTRILEEIIRKRENLNKSLK